jgi:hypothetical protein
MTETRSRVHTAWTQQIFYIGIDTNGQGQIIATTQQGMVTGNTGCIVLAAKTFAEKQLHSQLWQGIPYLGNITSLGRIAGKALRVNDFTNQFTQRGWWRRRIRGAGNEDFVGTIATGSHYQ